MLKKTRGVFILSLLICVGIQGNGLYAREGYLSEWSPANWDKEVRGETTFRELISKKGEEERYETIKNPKSIGLLVNVQEEALSVNAHVVRYKIENKGEQKRFIKVSQTLAIPLSEYDWWNGYSNKIQTHFDPDDVALSQWFPSNSAIGKEMGISLGLDPMEVYSRVETGHDAKGKQLSLELPIVLDPGESRTVSFVMTTFPARYGYRDAVQNYYDLFPKAYYPAENIHPSVISTQSTYLYWKPGEGEKTGNYNIRYSDDMIRRFSGGLGGWEWCYAPFVRGGDWAITDEWSEGFKKYTKERLQKARERLHERFARAESLNVAPMYYVNVLWSEKSLIEEHFPEVQSNPHTRVSWGNPAVFGLYPWANSYGDLFVQSLKRIAEEYPESRGIAWDSVFGHQRAGEHVAGVKETEFRSFDKGSEFVLLGVGYTPLLDLNHQLKSEEYTRANAVNLKLVSPYFIGARTDSALYEGHPVEDPKRLMRYEVMRANLGTQKALSWHKHLIPDRIRWVDWDSMEPAQMRDSLRQLNQDALFLSYFWGAIPSPGMPTLGVPFVFKHIPTLIELTKLGWQPSPGVDGPKDLLYARYGKGAGAVIAVINPDFSEKDAELKFPSEYWGGKQLLLTRQDGGALEIEVGRDSTQVRLNLPSRAVTLLRVEGVLKANLYGSPADVVRVSPLLNAPLGVERWRFEVDTYDIRNWEVEWVHPQGTASTRVRIRRDEKEFALNQPILFNLDSSTWPDEVQEMNRRTGSFIVSHYPRIDNQLITQKVNRLPWFTAKGGGSQVLFEGVDAHDQEGILRQLDLWFLMYSTNVLGREQLVSREPTDVRLPVTIRIQIDAEGQFEKECIASIQQTKEGVLLRIKGREFLQEALRSFLLSMDQAFPFYGELLSKNKEFDELGLAGHVLEEKMEQPDFILKPTLLDRLEKNFN